MTACVVQLTWANLNRRDRIYIGWPILEAPEGATWTILIEGDAIWHSLTVQDEEAIGWFAGPDFPTPDGAIVVANTAHCELRCTAGNMQVTVDGGFIQLVG